MLSHRPLRVSLVLALATTGAVAYAIAPLEVSNDSVGRVHLGDSPGTLQESELIGRVGPGCELAGPKVRSAKLKQAPVKGVVNLTLDRPRVVDNIQVTAGAEAFGVGIGDRKSDVRAAFPNAEFERVPALSVILAKIPKSDGGKFQFAIDPASKEIVTIGVPIVAFCE